MGGWCSAAGEFERLIVLSRLKKKVMIISQDAGKGCEDYKLHCVFSLHQAARDLNAYFRAHRTHEAYYKMFKTMCGNKFLQSIYFTDIIKCAYSTKTKKNRINVKQCQCRTRILDEVFVVEPRVIVLMGSEAQNTFKDIIKANNINLDIKPISHTRINRRSIIKFSEFKIKYNGRVISVFCIPHFVGRLFIENSCKKGFDKFKNCCLLTIKKRIRITKF
ncbi:MAG: uracil-DNA glycosylase family protein [Spirochaetes bacterium]|nr:uracil-DNA glycosylase family protein [Spirochaetota bacterium]